MPELVPLPYTEEEQTAFAEQFMHRLSQTTGELGPGFVTKEEFTRLVATLLFYRDQLDIYEEDRAGNMSGITRNDS